MKNHTEIECCSIFHSPKNYVQRDESNCNHNCPHDRTMQEREIAFGVNLGQSINQSLEFVLRLWRGHQTYRDRDDDVYEKRPHCTIDVLRHVLCVGREGDILQRGWIHLDPGPQ